MGLIFVGFHDEAVSLFIMFDTFARLGELVALFTVDLIPPAPTRGLGRWSIEICPLERGEVSKTGTTDDTVPVHNSDVCLDKAC